MVAWHPAMCIARGVPVEELPSTDVPAITVDWDLAHTIEQMWISPYAPEWYQEVVAAVIEKFAPISAVESSGRV